MDFELDSRQRQLKDRLDRFVAERYAQARPDAGASLWREFAALGLLGLPFAREEGGGGGGPVETLVVMEALGRALAPEPYLPSIVLAGGVLRAAGSAAQRRTFVPRLAAGAMRMAFAHAERQARYALHDVTLTASPCAGGYVLSGEKVLVLEGRGAETLIVSARTAGTPWDRRGISLFLVPADAPGLTLTAYPTQDGGRAADLVLDDVVVAADRRLGPEGEALGAIEQAVDVTLAALAAEAVGIMAALYRLTVDFLKSRRQFGRTLDGFQAPQHKAVDMYVALEQARSMAFYAAAMAGAPDAALRSAALAAAKVQINRSARFIGQTAVQLHGAVGMTMDYLGARYFRRLMAIEASFGDTDYHLRRLVAAENRLDEESALEEPWAEPQHATPPPRLDAFGEAAERDFA